MMFFIRFLNRGHRIGLSLLWVMGIFVSSAAAKEMTIRPFTQNVLKHVLLHELGHAVMREFNLPKTANEEAMADSFATTYITQNMRDEAPQIIVARVHSWMLEDRQRGTKPYDFKGEHMVDIRRAYQTACLFYGADSAEWQQYIEEFGFSKHDLAACADTARDQIAGWQQLLPLTLLQDDDKSPNVEVIFGEGPYKSAMQKTQLIAWFADVVRQFNWPEKVTINFDHCDKGASWNRQERRILLCDNYVERFNRQAEELR